MSLFSYSVTRQWVKGMILPGHVHNVRNAIAAFSTTPAFRASANREPLGKSEESQEDDHEQEPEVKQRQPREEAVTNPEEKQPIEKKKLSITERLMKMSMESSVDLGFDYDKNIGKPIKPMDEFQSKFEYNPRSPRTKVVKHSTPATTKLDDLDPKAISLAIETTIRNLPNRTNTKADPSDTFGVLSFGSSDDDFQTEVRKERLQAEFHIHEDEREEDDSFFIPEDRWSDHKLKMKIKELLREKKLTAALDILTDALKDSSYYYDKYKLGYLYALIIIQCGKNGYVEMAFKLFRDYVKRGIKVKPQLFTYLLNACANSPWDKEKNLERITRLRENMLTHGVQQNEIHYHAMIKAYGRCGDLQSAFSVVDDMISPSNPNRVRFNVDTFAFLLQATITDRQNGFRHALVTWKKMETMKFKPNIFCYNLFLRATRECGFEDVDVFSENLLGSGAPVGQIQQIEAGQPVLVPTGGNSLFSYSANRNSGALLHDVKSDIDSLKIPENRLALLGGFQAILTQMTHDAVTPDIKTITEFVQIVPVSTLSDVFALLDKFNIKPDIHFFNLLMKRYMLAHDVQKGRQVLELLPDCQMTPNVMTWGIMAIGCSGWTQGKALLKDMEAANLMPNREIMGALLKNATRLFDPRYVLRVMEEMRILGIPPDKKFLEDLQHFRDTTQAGIINSETGKDVHPHSLKIALQDEEFKDFWKKFKYRYADYMSAAEKEVGKIDPDDPWKEDFNERKVKRKEKGLVF